jgi:hypothetical protein
MKPSDQQFQRLKIYTQTFRNGESVYFVPMHQQKNGRWEGPTWGTKPDGKMGRSVTRRGEYWHANWKPA